MLTISFSNWNFSIYGNSIKFWNELTKISYLILKYIYDERMWIFPTIAAIIVPLLIYIIKKKHDRSFAPSPKKSLENEINEEDIIPHDLENEELQVIFQYIEKEKTDIFLTLSPGSTTLFVGDIVGSDELFIHLPWANYLGAVWPEELVGYLTQVISTEKQILLLGEPGQGKTTVMKRVFTIMADRFIKKPDEVIPIYIALRDISYPDDKSGETLLLLWKYLHNKRNPLPLSYDQFLFLLRKNKIIFLFDGFDEMAMELSQPSINKRASNEIFSQLSILSCRNNFYQQFLSTSVIQQNYLEKIELLPLKFDEDTIKYIIVFCNRKGKKPDNIIRTIKENKELLDLAQRPMLLNMMVDVLTDSQESFEIEWNISKLYEIYTEKWLKNEAMKPDSVLRWHEKAALMEEIAWSIYQTEAPSSYSYGDRFQQNATFTRTNFSKYLQQHADKYQNITFSKIVDDICFRTFLIGSYGDYYYFIHKSFQEYYVAKYIFRSMQSSSENAAKTLQVSTPAEVASFLEDLLSSKQVSKHEKDSIVYNLISAYQQNVKEDLRSLIIREHTCYYLSRLGTQNAILFLEQTLEKELNKWVQRAIIVGLGIFCGRQDLLENYITILDKDKEAASINIGYNLAYYGDQSLEEGYYDRGGEKCDGILRAIFRHLKSEKYKAIWALDLLTLRTLLQDERRGMSILQVNDEYTLILKDFLRKDTKDNSVVLDQEKKLMQNFLENTVEN